MFSKNRNWKSEVLAVGVLIIIGYQLYWYFTIDNSPLLVVSAVINIVFIVILLKPNLINDRDMFGQKNKMRMNSNAFSEKLSSDSKVYCNDELIEYLVSTKDVLTQTEQLVNHAVINLIVNFKYISELTRSEQDMILSVEKMMLTIDQVEIVKLLRRQKMMIKRINQELASITISMQFGDTVVQLLQHATKKIDTLETILRRTASDDLPKENDCSSEEKHQTKFIVQQDMQPGDIEIFSTKVIDS